MSNEGIRTYDDNKRYHSVPDQPDLLTGGYNGDTGIDTSKYPKTEVKITTTHLSKCGDREQIKEIVRQWLENNGHSSVDGCGYCNFKSINITNNCSDCLVTLLLSTLRTEDEVKAEERKITAEYLYDWCLYNEPLFTHKIFMELLMKVLLNLEQGKSPEEVTQ